ncbi:cytochrome P450 [Pholiota conissans]|uniref:Cytochrome P450 n=1 Tax=Pholiota conissans TaxID=109636 RepID=A0A9P5Z4B2_9AGAR|nr:cytochrome P450 [Pholiota conissans]
MISPSLVLWALQRLGLALGGSMVLFCVYQTLELLYAELTSPLRDLPGPPSENMFFGNFRELFSSDSSAVQQKWTEKYGKTIKYKGIMGITRLYTTDLKAVNHFLVNTQTYQKPAAAIYNLTRILGEGVLVVEGDAHKLQRKLLNPAFGPQQIRELTEIFVEKSIQLRDRWIEEILKQTGKESEGLPAKIDGLSWLSRTTLDVIGLAGFNYKFDSLTDSPEKNELSEAFAVMFRTSTSLNPIAALRGLFPALRFLPAPGDTESGLASKTMFSIGAQLLADSKASNATQNEKSSHARDILSILVHANSATDLSENQRLNDKDVLAQIPTFMVAGHETTSVAVTWALFALTQKRDIQDKLRDELSTISTDNPTMDELNSLPYLDAVVRETLRLHAPVPSSMRAAVKDDVVPLSEPYVDKHGKKHETVTIKKGQMIMIPIVPINKSKDLWGDDAWEFNPDRWQNLPEAVSAVPSVWGNMMTFIGGPRACIGYRFSIIEMKALIFTLVRAFDFDLAVPAKDIVKKSSIVNRPVLLTASGKNENQMPLLVRIANSD